LTNAAKETTALYCITAVPLRDVENMAYNARISQMLRLNNRTM
jgi:hypothetical protein